MFGLSIGGVLGRGKRRAIVTPPKYSRGMAGYRQDGSNVVCRNCASAIYIPTIGQAGGCNPVGVASRAENGALVIDVSSLTDARSKVSK